MTIVLQGVTASQLLGANSGAAGQADGQITLIDRTVEMDTMPVGGVFPQTGVNLVHKSISMNSGVGAGVISAQGVVLGFMILDVDNSVREGQHTLRNVNVLNRNIGLENSVPEATLLTSGVGLVGGAFHLDNSVREALVPTANVRVNPIVQIDAATSGLGDGAVNSPLTLRGRAIEIDNTPEGVLPTSGIGLARLAFKAAASGQVSSPLNLRRYTGYELTAIERF